MTVYCTVALTAVEAPCLLVRVTATLVTLVAFDGIVNGCANVNRLPYCSDAGLLYHAPNSWSAGIVKLDVASVPPEAWKSNFALVISRELENPVTCT